MEHRYSHLRLALVRLLPRLDSPVLWCFALAVMAFEAAYLLPISLLRYFAIADLDAYAVAARHVVTGQQLYPLMPRGDIPVPGGTWIAFLYPPPFAAALAPLGYLTHLAAVRILFVVTFASFWAYAAVLGRMLTGRWSFRGFLAANLIVSLVPGGAFCLIAGQIEPLLWLAFALAVTTPAGGALLAASCLVKPFAALPLAVAAWREPRKVILQAALVLVVGLLLGGLVCGWGSYLDWLSYAPNRLYRVAFHPANISLSLLPLRLLGYTRLPDWGRLFLLGMYALMPGLVAWVMRKRPVEVQVAWVGAAAILFAPFSHVYYLPLLLTPLALEVREAKTEVRKDRRTGDGESAK